MTNLRDISPDNPPPTDIRIASFNIHSGVDGWGRPFDVIGTCAEIDADVLILAESFAPDGDASNARLIGEALGYRVEEFPFARSRLAAEPQVPAAGDTRWGPPMLTRDAKSVLTLEPPRDTRRAPGQARRAIIRGSWNLAVLSRVPIGPIEAYRLPVLRERARRSAAIFSVPCGTGKLTVIGTHLAHLSRGSAFQIRGLRRYLAGRDGPFVLLGDMNSWGPVLLALLPGWRRAVRGRTWPAWSPHSQIDHILVTKGVRVIEAEVLRDFGSDHRPVRARLSC